VRFELAVDLDKGYEYRVVDFDDDGNMTPGDWVAVKHWTGVLDVSREFEEPEDTARESTGDVDENEE
jgi:hypothetical protein